MCALLVHVPVGGRRSFARAAARVLGPTTLAATLMAGGCRLEDVSLADPADVVVAEMVLQAGDSQQVALLHRTLAGRSLSVPGATVQLTWPGGGVVTLQPVPGSRCVNAGATFNPDTISSCYATAPGEESLVVPGGTYHLRIQTTDGRVLTGVTTVPRDFQLVRPKEKQQCYLAPRTLLPIEWTRSDSAWVYLSETRLQNIRRALDGSAPTNGSLDMVGLSVTAADTTIVFPAEFGLFDRGDESDTPILVALQDGLPAGVTASVTVAAADRNYVQWVRRGTFNPSGTIQIPSMQGDGTGVFGSMVPKRFTLTSTNNGRFPSCSS